MPIQAGDCSFFYIKIKFISRRKYLWTKKKYYQVFIKRDYVRDTQVFGGDCLSDDIDIYDEEHERNWHDAEGDLLILERYACDVQEIVSQIRQLYPDASHNIFRIQMFGPYGVYELDDISWNLNDLI